MPPADQPTFSIVIPVKDRAGLVVETLDSVRAQTLPEWEAVVVDDGSTDETCATVERMAAEDSRIRLIRRQGGNPGAPAYLSSAGYRREMEFYDA